MTPILARCELTITETTTPATAVYYWPKNVRRTEDMAGNKGNLADIVDV